jgi:uncharacterized phage protein gp47/JayE
MTTDALTSTGLTTQSLSDLVTALNTGLQGIYGTDINVDSNSPDGQLINIIAQAGVDIRELATQIYNNFDPDQASGTVLDQRVALNNIQRGGGTYTVQPVDITVDRTLTLAGLDANYNSLSGTGYTVQDANGNQFILSTTTTLTAGTTTLNFRAAKIGAVETTTGTITNQVTVVLGVTAVNNSSAEISVGQNQETDAQLRLRRQKSPALASSDYLNGMLASILALTGVVDAELYENFTDTADSNGIPAHGMWLIVDGGSSSDIANVIYKKKSYGCNMKGSQTYNITTASGIVFTSQWDQPISERLYVKFNLKKLVSTTVFDTTAIAAAIASAQSFEIGGDADMGSLTQTALNVVAANGGGGLVLDMAISTDGLTYTDVITPTSPQYKFTLASTDIAITVV